MRPSWSGRSARKAPRCRCGPSARARRTRHDVLRGCRPNWPRRTVPSRPSGPTSRSCPTSPARTSSTRTRGTRTSPGISPHCCTGIPHVVTAHSLEPLRPWKAEQLGGGYAVSSYIEKTAYEGAAAVVAVSEGMRQDILRSYPALDPGKVRVIYNGIDTEAWHPVSDDEFLASVGIDRARPSVVFVGRITARRGCRTCCARPSSCRRTSSSCCARAPRTPRRSSPRSRNSSAVSKPPARVSYGSTGCCPPRAVRDPHRGHDVRLPVGVRAPRHRQPRGHGLRCGGRRYRDRGHPEVVVDGVTGRLVPIEQLQDGTGTPSTRSASSTI